MSIIEDLYSSTMEAFKAWMEALIKAYGEKEANYARYDERGFATPELRRLRDERRQAAKAFNDASHNPQLWTNNSGKQGNDTIQ
jgi:hypothetical protein